MRGIALLTASMLFMEHLDGMIVADDDALIDYRTHADADLAVPETEHYLPLLYVLGAREPAEAPKVFNRQFLASVSMTCYAFDLPA